VHMYLVCICICESVLCAFVVCLLPVPGRLNRRRNTRRLLWCEESVHMFQGVTQLTRELILLFLPALIACTFARVSRAPYRIMMILKIT
jgi:hypothetical protein